MQFDAMNSTLSRLREHYKPQTVGLLFIAESPPVSDEDEVRFFYNPRQERWDHMYRSVMKAAFPNFEYCPGEKDRWLSKFKQRGYYMIDASDTPINRLSSRQRSRILNEALKEKLSEIAALVSRNTPIILVKRSVFEALVGPLRHAGYNVIQESFLPFPSHGHQARFIDACRKALEKHREGR